jgi:Flp pilus assembly pilin Flp
MNYVPTYIVDLNARYNTIEIRNIGLKFHRILAERLGKAKSNMKLMQVLKAWYKDESGQTTTEYILILAVIVTIFMQFRKKLTEMVGKIFGQLDTATEGIIED